MTKNIIKAGLFLIGSFLTFGLYKHANTAQYYVLTAILWLIILFILPIIDSE